MKLSPSLLTAFLAMSLCFHSTRAETEGSEELLQQIISQASQNADPATAAQVQKFALENKGLLDQIVANYRQQLDSAANLVEGTAAETKEKLPAVSLTNNPATNAVAVSGGLQVSHLQSSGGLNDPHLAGYPALPEVAPASSILHPTAAQIAHKKELDDATRERKLFLMQHPTSDR